MPFFNQAEPILRSKQEALDFQDRQGLIDIKLTIGKKILFSAIYTRIDQVFALWAIISAFIFITGQFSPIDWFKQAIFWSVLTVIGTAATIALTHFWVKVERLCWVLYLWVALMLTGLVITDSGIFLGWAEVLIHLSHLWLGLSAIGYFITGLGMRSRSFVIAGIIHLFGIAILPYFSCWQFLTTGIIVASNLVVFAQRQWDMRPPIENYSLLTQEQQQFNLEQYKLRQAS